MSTFGGIISHFPWLSIDRFDGENLKSKLFLLSHAHWDHMQGIKDPNFKGPLYCSAITKLFVEYEQPNIEFRVLEIGEPVLLKCDEGEVLVTAFPAYHCPGSVMFALQSNKITVLYTGDIRFQVKEDIEKMVMLKQYKFEEIYLDSTFFRRDFLDFPSQQESVNQICSLIEEWLWKDPNNEVFLETSARYGYEYLFIEIYKKIKKRIWVPNDEFKKYRRIPGLDEATTDMNASIYAKRISCFTSKKSVEGLEHLLRIKVSAWRWKQWKDETSIVEKQGPNYFFVCYSNHSSYTEICNFVKYFKPKTVFFNVVTENDPNALAEMQQSLKEILDEIHGQQDNDHDKNEQGNGDKNSSENLDETFTISLSSIPRFGSKRRVENCSLRPIPAFKKRTKL